MFYPLTDADSFISLNSVIYNAYTVSELLLLIYCLFYSLSCTHMQLLSACEREFRRKREGWGEETRTRKKGSRRE